MAKWTLTYNGETKSLAKWGLGHVTRRLRNQDEDIVTAQCVRRLHEDPLFKPESKILIKKDATIWFQGIVTKTPSIGDYRSETSVYEISGPWWYLNNLVYQQKWNSTDNNQNQNNLILNQNIVNILNDPNTVLVDKTRVILGQDSTGQAITLQEQIKNILNFAINNHAPIALGSIKLEKFQIPFDEVKDISCAEAIRRLLRWIPDTITWFDYTQEVPKLHIARKAKLKKTSIDLTGKNIKNIRITPRNLSIPSVVLYYENLHRINQNVYRTVTIDKYPENATGKEFKALVLTIELEGNNIQIQEQHIKTNAVNANNIAWWKERLPALKDIEDDKIKIKDVTRSSKLLNELIEGSIAPWMSDAKAETDTIRATISYETDHSAVVDKTIAVRIQATDASSQMYLSQDAIVKKEATVVTPGLAKQVFEAVNSVKYDGEISLENEEIGLETLLGTVLNITNSHANHAKMEALIQEVREDVDKGITWIKFGPAKHLGPDDLAELMRVNRNRYASPNASSRANSHIHQKKISHPTHGRIESAHSDLGHYRKLTFKDPENKNHHITIDTHHIPKNIDAKVQLRKHFVNHEGTLKEMLTLSSEPFNIVEE